jgi:transcriptional regulator with PAS, ATPase and Fis domain
MKAIDEILGTSEKITEIKQIIYQVAPVNISVLIIGESGTGKELIAKALHEESARKDKPLINVNCGAIPEGILESELFGHEKGSFTGASARRKGYFEAADKGTIFLDEIGEMSLSTQVKLLRVLEQGEFMRVGGTETIKVDVKIIAATNKDLEKSVDKGTFRKDLYYRLKAVTIKIPTLRERKVDIEILAEHFLKDFGKKNGFPTKGISPLAIKVLQDYSWPGNIRELKNLLESLVVLKKGEIIKHFDIPDNYSEHGNEKNINLPVHLNKSSEQAEREIIYRTLLSLKSDLMEIKENLFNRHSYPHLSPTKEIFRGEIEAQDYVKEVDPGDNLSLEKLEKTSILEALEKFNGNRKKTASVLGISERTLYRKINKIKKELKNE